MRIAVIGGALQGLEVVYLARKAGYWVRLVDKRKNVPARPFCQEFLQGNVLEATTLAELAKNVDVVFPALESVDALESLAGFCVLHNIPFIHDPAAYAVSVSKLASDGLFRNIGIPAPAYWPGCRYPVIAKPDTGSGSQGVRFFQSRSGLAGFLDTGHLLQDWVIQEYVPGPSFSIEVVRMGGRGTALQVTDLYMDSDYDCKRVTAPSRLSLSDQAGLKQMGLQIADALDLNGIMDLEVVWNRGRFYALEIDARFPSQTPIAVFWSTGVNMVSALAGQAIGHLWNPEPISPRGVILEHVQVTDGILRVLGEHILTNPDRLSIQPGLWGTTEAITDFAPDRDHWVATLICTGNDLLAAWRQRKSVIQTIQNEFLLDGIEDREPDQSDIFDGDG